MLILTIRMTSKNYTFLWSLKQCVDILASLTSFHAKMMELIWSSVHLSGIHLVFSRFYTSDGSCTCNPGFIGFYSSKLYYMRAYLMILQNCESLSEILKKMKKLLVQLAFLNSYISSFDLIFNSQNPKSKFQVPARRRSITIFILHCLFHPNYNPRSNHLHHKRTAYADIRQ